MKIVKFWRVGPIFVGMLSAALLLVSSTCGAASGGGTPTYSMSIKASIPTGGAGATKPSASSPAGSQVQWPSLTYTPCSTALGTDLISFSITYNAGQPATSSSSSSIKDVYLILIKPDKTFLVVSRGLTTGVTLTPILNAAALTAAKKTGTSLYAPAASDPGGSIGPEFLISQNLYVDGALTGTWQLVGIVADSKTVDFDDPTTWLAFDTAQVILGAPWTLNTRALATTIPGAANLGGDSATATTPATPPNPSSSTDGTTFNVFNSSNALYAGPYVPGTSGGGSMCP